MGAVDTPCWDAAVSSGSQFGPERDWKEVLTWGSICGQPRLARSSHFLVFLRGKKIKIKALSWSPCETTLPCEVHPSTLPAWVLINLYFKRFTFFFFPPLSYFHFPFIPFPISFSTLFLTLLVLLSHLLLPIPFLPPPFFFPFSFPHYFFSFSSFSSSLPLILIPILTHIFLLLFPSHPLLSQSHSTCTPSALIFTTPAVYRAPWGGQHQTVPRDQSGLGPWGTGHCPWPPYWPHWHR